ncbi:MAG TPA: hypothetical protein VGC45_02855 [Gryllotalpicola sp.]
MNEYTVELPLWAEDGLPLPETWDILPTGLLADLRTWAQGFNDAYDGETGTWSPGFDVDAYFGTAEGLRDRLQAELGPEVAVVWHRWESARVRPR